MSNIVSWNGTSYTVPETGEENWGGTTKVDGLLVSLATNGFQKTGGNFTLSADVDFGGSAGLKTAYYKSRAATVAAAGIVRLAKTEKISWRNNADGGDNYLTTDTSDNLLYNGVAIASSTGVTPVAAGGTGLSSYTAGDMIYASGTTTLAKLAIGTANKVLTTNGSVPSWNLLVNANIDASAAIAYSKLNLSGSILNADVNASAAIARSKLATGTASYVLINDGSGVMSEEAALSPVRGGTGVANNAACTLTRSGNHALTLTTTNTTSLTLPTTGTLATLAGAETFSNKTFSDAPTIAEIATPSTPSSGFGKVYFKSDGKLYTLNDDGTETQVGSGAGGINYISANPDAESSTTGWATYADAAATTPVDGTGGSPNVTWTRSTSSPLRGTASFLLTKDAANRQGEGVSYDFTIASADKCKALTISFEYEVSSNFVAGSDSTTGDVVVYIYDVTNSTLIQPAGYKLTGGSTGGPWKFSGSFQSSTSTSYRLILHISGTTSTAWTMKVDTVSVGPTVQIIGAAVSDWNSFTPTGSWVSNTTYTGFWRRSGDSMECIVKLALSGAPTSTTLTVNLPSGYSIDTAKVLGTTAAGNDTVFGVAAVEDSGTGTYEGDVVYNSTTSVTPRQYFADAVGIINATTPFTFASGDKITMRFFVPILGWGTSLTLSQDADPRVMSCRYELATGSTVSNGGVVVAFNTKIYDTHGTTVASGVFTAPSSGYYRLTCNIVTVSYVAGAVDRKLWATARKNGSAYAIIAKTVANTTTSCAKALNGSVVVPLNAGDTLDVITTNDDASTTSSATQNETYITIEKLSGSQAIATTESVNALYESNTARSISNNSATTGEFLMEDLVFDTHGAYNTSTAIFTVPVAGKYRVSAMVELASNAGWDRNETLEIDLYKNGSLNRVMGGVYAETTNTLTKQVSGTTVVKCVAGDTLEVRIFQNTGGAINTSGTQQKNWVEYDRIGN